MLLRVIQSVFDRSQSLFRDHGRDAAASGKRQAGFRRDIGRASCKYLPEVERACNGMKLALTDRDPRDVRNRPGRLASYHSR
jgi:hypothetical protein